MQKKSVREITLAAMFGAIYGVMLTLIRFFFHSSDSLIYYFLPIPLAFYSLEKEGSYSISLLLIAGILGFLLVDPIRALMLIIPNLILGFVIGVLLRKNPGFLKIFVMFLIALAVDFLSIYAFEVITGISYFTSTLEEFMNIFHVSEGVLKQIILIIIPVVLIIDSLMKVIIILMVLKILTLSLKFKDMKTFKIKVDLSLKPLYSISFLAFLALTIVSFTTFNLDLNALKFITIISFSLLIISSLIIFFNTSIYLKYYFHKKEKFFNKHPFILSLILLLCFPIVLVLGLILNLFTTKAELFLAK